jgi:hypothetical protein
MLKVIIVNNEANLSVEKGSGENTLKFTVFKDAVTSELFGVEVNRDELDRVIGFVMGDDLPEDQEPFPTPAPNPDPELPVPIPEFPSDPFPDPFPIPFPRK